MTTTVKCHSAYLEFVLSSQTRLDLGHVRASLAGYALSTSLQLTIGVSLAQHAMEEFASFIMAKLASMMVNVARISAHLLLIGNLGKLNKASALVLIYAEPVTIALQAVASST